MENYKKNPNDMSKKTTNMHPNHKGRVVRCMICANESMEKKREMLLCYNCGSNSILFSESDTWKKWHMYKGDQAPPLYCSACHMHWRQTDIW